MTYLLNRYCRVISGLFCMVLAINAYSHEPERTAIEEQRESEKVVEKVPGVIALYNPNYILPIYHTNSPYNTIYEGNTPNNQIIMKNEFKSQISVLLPLLSYHFLNKPSSLSAAYTQLMYWQFYAKSQFFRETNYQPEVFMQMLVNRYVEVQLGINHQSNGRGGILERSWNRVIGQLAISNARWYVQLRAWALIAQAQSSDLHNPRIAHYLGHDNLVLSVNVHDFTVSGQVQNIESGLKRGFFIASVSYPIINNLSIYAQFFNGYGQSLIEYDHRTASFGIGVALNDWG